MKTNELHKFTDVYMLYPNIQNNEQWCEPFLQHKLIKVRIELSVGEEKCTS